jgi:GH15 family glucan-1,4-alpha-glucosidase
VHSKVMCWAALDRGLRIAEETGREVPSERWAGIRDRIKEDVEEKGVDPDRGCFVRTYGSPEVDGALLLVPKVEFVDWSDDRMIRTADAVAEDLGTGHGLYRRYTVDDELPGREGAFLPVSFWLAECLARQGREAQAREAFDRGCEAANDLGLFAEEADPRTGELLGNFPQALTHLTHISAALALGGVPPSVEEEAG